MACYSTCTAIILRQSQDKYFAYGKDRDTANNVPTDHKFTGQKQDASGLMYYASRYYDPQTGLFVSPDTLVPDAGRVSAYNRTMYARGNPLNYIDPTGHADEKPADPEAFEEVQTVVEELMARVDLEIAESLAQEAAAEAEWAQIQTAQDSQPLLSNAANMEVTAESASTTSEIGSSVSAETVSSEVQAIEGNKDLVRYASSDGQNFQFKTGHGFYREHSGPGGVITDLRPTTLTPDSIESSIIFSFR